MKKILSRMVFFIMNLALFDGNTNKTTDTTATTGNNLSPEMKTYYSAYLIDNAEPELVHDQFGQKHPIPKNGGKTIEFRKYDPLPKALTPLTEGVTPDGQKLNVSTITATVAQYGAFIELSDVLLLTAIDNNLLQATKLLGSQAGRTLDTVTREVLNGGTNVQYADGSVTKRAALVGGESSGNTYLTVTAIRKAARFLKVMNAPRINGDYVAIIHPDAAYDLMSDPEWKYPHQYADPTNIYTGEIGKVAGVRFVETSEAKVFHAENLAGTVRNLAINYVSGYTGAITSVTFDGGTVANDALIGRKIMINGVVATVTDNTSSTITFASTNFGSISDNTVIYPGEAGAKGRDVYSTLVLGDDAYGVTEIEGGGLQHIVKQLGSAGTADPLNQRATAGFKALKVAERLTEGFMVRIETASTFNS